MDLPTTFQAVTKYSGKNAQTKKKAQLPRYQCRLVVCLWIFHAHKIATQAAIIYQRRINNTTNET